MAGIGVQAEFAAAAHDRGRFEICRLQKHIARGVGDARVQPAHQAGQCHRAICVGDGEEAVVQRDLTAIEQCQLLASTRAPHANRPMQRIQVEGMHRLAELQHHVLGDIHQQRHRAHAAAAQALGHPHRCGRRRIDAFDHTPAIARRLAAGIELDRERARRYRRHGSRIKGDDFAGAGSRHVEGDTAHAEAVGAVGGELDFDAGIGQTEILGQRLAHRRIVRQLEQARGVTVQAKLLGRAQHAIGRHTAQLGRLDRQLADLRTDQGQWRDQASARIGRTADDLQQLALPRVDAAHLQAIGLRMAHRRDDPRHHHLAQRITQRRDRFDFQANGRQRRGKLLAARLDRNVAA